MSTTTETEIAATQELARKRRNVERKAQDLREDRTASEEKIKALFTALLDPENGTVTDQLTEERQNLKRILAALQAAETELGITKSSPELEAAERALVLQQEQDAQQKLREAFDLLPIVRPN